MSKIVIFADGGSRRNGKENNVGAWGAVISYKGKSKEMCKAEKNTTNNIQELKGVINALQIIKTAHIPVKVYSDSKYVVKGITEWVNRWIKKNWVNSKKQPVKNKELWMQLHGLVQQQEDISFEWVKGHSDSEGNELADSLANKAMDELELKME